jgi:hypothetical protein
MVLAARLVAAALILALAGDYYALCAGWLPTAEARMACCVDGTCPMHQRHDETAGSNRLTQAQADACCAASEQHDAEPSARPTVLAAAIDAPDVPAAFEPARTLDTGNVGPVTAPSPPGHVPKHVLLSVFLV